MPPGIGPNARNSYWRTERGLWKRPKKKATSRQNDPSEGRETEAKQYSDKVKKLKLDPALDLLEYLVSFWFVSESLFSVKT